MNLQKLLYEYLDIENNSFAQYLIWVKVADRPEFDTWLKQKGIEVKLSKPSIYRANSSTTRIPSQKTSKNFS